MQEKSLLTNLKSNGIENKKDSDTLIETNAFIKRITNKLQF